LFIILCIIYIYIYIIIFKKIKETPVKFEFLIDGKFLKGSLKKYLDDNNLSSVSI